MSVSDYFSLRTMPTGRYAFSLKRMRARADAAGLDDVVSRIDRAVEQAQSTLALELKWSKVRNNKSSARGNAAIIDNQIDEQIAAIERRVRAETVGDEDDPVVEKAREFLAALFPDGVAAITQQAFEVQLGIMDAMMERIDGDLSAHIAELGLQRHISRLRRLIEDFRTELEDHDDPQVSYDQVKGARATLHEYTCRALVAVFYVLDDEDDQTIETRRHILAPLVRQKELVAEARRRHRVLTDVDPDTGDEVVDEAEPTDEDVEPQPDPTPDTEPDVEPAEA